MSSFLKAGVIFNLDRHYTGSEQRRLLVQVKVWDALKSPCATMCICINHHDNCLLSVPGRVKKKGGRRERDGDILLTRCILISHFANIFALYFAMLFIPICLSHNYRMKRRGHKCPGWITFPSVDSRFIHFISVSEIQKINYNGVWKMVKYVSALLEIP